MAKKSFARYKKKGHRRTFFILALVVGLATLLCFTGLRVPNGVGGYTTLYGARDMRFGIDIQGGVEAVFVPADYDGTPTESQLEAVKQILETRLDNLNILDRDIISSSQTGRVTVRFPWQSGESTFNPDEAIEELGATASLTFVDEDGNEVLSGADVKEAKGGVNSQTGESIVTLELTSDGATKFAEATEANLGKTITIKMDDEVLSSPTVESVITDGDAMITGMSSAEEAVQLANQINAGALPFAIEAISTRSISPSMGSEALGVMFKAGIIAFVLLCLFLLLNYRLSGLVAVFSLLGQVVGVLLAISIPQQTLTLQGIAGIILSIGMGVDANVIVSERIREEVRSGRNVREAVEVGFDRAFASVLDGNVTVAISSVCLIIFGSGSILSFGYSLLVGVILNLVCGAWLSHYMTRSLVQFDALNKPWLFGARRLTQSKEVSVNA
ncbi:MAG: protein translocase subunit SecD [Oscillospiraceae bacterium]|nr:protein translocase subunit SecD [Oscillospiraceae bacterium]